MTDLRFSVTGAACEAHAAVPTLMFRLLAEELSGTKVHALALRCQVRIEPARRAYNAEERAKLYELFGDAGQWGSSVRPFLWAHLATVVGAFEGSAELDLPMGLSYDFEVVASKYMHALSGGEIPLVFLFSGTVFSVSEGGFAAEPVPWDRSAQFRLPVSLWRQCMGSYFPGTGWLRLSREAIDGLARFKAERALPSFDMAVEQLLKEAGQKEGEP
jgi:hypothetical protein